MVGRVIRVGQTVLKTLDFVRRRKRERTERRQAVTGAENIIKRRGDVVALPTAPTCERRLLSGHSLERALEATTRKDAVSPWCQSFAAISKQFAEMCVQVHEDDCGHLCLAHTLHQRGCLGRALQFRALGQARLQVRDYSQEFRPAFQTQSLRQCNVHRTFAELPSLGLADGHKAVSPPEQRHAITGTSQLLLGQSVVPCLAQVMEHARSMATPLPEVDLLEAEDVWAMLQRKA
mmetsp:Transcript_84806/g.236644  ORF Transcript_84806/g.236644 Transcript_84806/m.236644 type:complete len:234 (+) Transcript_84806:443-1144(+)